MSAPLFLVSLLTLLVLSVLTSSSTSVSASSSSTGAASTSSIPSLSLNCSTTYFVPGPGALINVQPIFNVLFNYNLAVVAVNGSSVSPAPPPVIYFVGVNKNEFEAQTLDGSVFARYLVGVLPYNSQYGYVGGVGVDPVSGDVFLCSFGNGAVLRFNSTNLATSSGTSIRTYTPPSGAGIPFIAYYKAGLLYTADFANKFVVYNASTGAVVALINNTFTARLTTLSVDNAGFIYTLDSFTGETAVVKFDIHGNVTARWNNSRGAHPLLGPSGCAIDSHGNIFVIDSYLGVVVLSGVNGSEIAFFPSLGTLKQVDVDVNDFVYASSNDFPAGSGESALLQYAPLAGAPAIAPPRSASCPTYSGPAPGTVIGSFNVTSTIGSPNDLALDNVNGLLWVTGVPIPIYGTGGNGELLRLNLSNAEQRLFNASTTRGLGSNSAGVTVDQKTGTVYVGDFNTGTVALLTKNGTFVTSYTSSLNAYGTNSGNALLFVPALNQTIYTDQYSFQFINRSAHAVIGTSIAYSAGLAVDSNSFIYNLGSEGPTTLQITNPITLVQTMFPAAAETERNIDQGGIAIDGLGNLYVCETASNSIRVFSIAMGQQIALWQFGALQPNGIAVDPNGQRLYVGDGLGKRILIVAAAGVAPNAAPPVVSSSSSPPVSSSSPALSPSSSSLSPSSSTSSPSLSSTRPSSVIGDPQLVGFLGQSFQVHGVDGFVYNLISDMVVQLNARFAFLGSGRCLRNSATGEKPFVCWSHPGSYLTQLGMRHAITRTTVVVIAGTAEEGFASVRVDNRNLHVGGEYISGYDLMVTYESLRMLRIQIGVYSMKIENSDGFVNILNLNVTDWTSLQRKVQPHGLIGQTWQRRHGIEGKPDWIEGQVDDYAESDSDLLGCGFAFNKHDCTHSPQPG